MMGRTHMAFGFLAGVVFYGVFHANWLIFIPLAVFGSLLPDIDHHNSKINRIIPVTQIVPTLFKHRGFFHSIWPAGILYFGFSAVGLGVYGIPLTVGYLSHLFSDCLTKLGCNLLHPLSTFRVQGFIYTDGPMELITLGVVYCLGALLVLQHIF